MNRLISSPKKANGFLRKFLAVMLAVGLLLSTAPIIPGMNWSAAAADELTGNTVQPVVVVTGQGIIAGGTYTAENIGNEKSYTLDELKAIANADPNSAANNQYLYSAYNTSDNASIYLGEGVRLDTLLAKSGVTSGIFSGNVISLEEVKADGSTGYSVKYDPAKTTVGEKSGASTSQHLGVTRYYYPNIKANGAGTADGLVEVPTILAWAKGGTKGSTEVPTTVTEFVYGIESMTGQIALNDYNNPLFNSDVKRVLVGDAVTEKPITINGIAKTRSEILLMPWAERSYTYEVSGGGSKTDYVRGVPLAVLAEGHANDELISFSAADGFTVPSVTVAEAKANNCLLAYEKGTGPTDLKGIYDTAKNDSSIHGYFTLYRDGGQPAKLINSITISAKNYTNSPYKHINNGGLTGSSPYNIDAITGATLTVEGPGVNLTTPIRMYDLESTANTNIYRGLYTDTRDSGPVTLNYEGVKVLSIIDGLVNSTVQKVDDNINIVFKNRWRQNVGSINYSDLKNAQTPVILAYGTGTADETKVAPFIYDGDTGAVAELGNEDGCIKLVYDKTALPNVSNNPKFVSVAYIYVERGDGRPGYKHSEAVDNAYKNVANTEHLITFTGSALGYEVNYTVAELEAMVQYGVDGLPVAGGLGHRDEYSLSNTTYWYVNEYEGIKLWDLLTTKLGLNADTYRNDENTQVWFAAWDNYQTTARFSMAQLANPDRFYFYEKSPLDIGTDRPTKAELATPEYQPDNRSGIWETDSNGYPVKKGYPVLLAYGVNGYPYVRDSRLPGYAGGLGNDGGPIRVIFGKTDGMNRDDSTALENYAYFYNNGSNQLQRAQEIYVGDNKRYSTHLENPNYSAMKDSTALTVEIVQSNGAKETKTYTLAQLESILYGQDVTKSDMEKQGRKEKGYYAYKDKGGLIEDLFEGVNLWYLLSEDIGMQGVLGTVSFYSGNDATSALDMTLTELQSEGYNSLRNTEGLGMMVAFAKNGYPLVSDKNPATGYVDTDAVTGKTIKNNDGPLMFLRAQTAAEKAAGAVGQGQPAYVSNLTKVVVNLEADVYAHTGDYATYGDSTVNFTGAVKNEGVTLKVSDIEKMQKYMVTGTYTVGGVTNTYRGVDLNRLLSSTSVGASALLSEVVVSNGTDSKTITVADITGAQQPIILAYGIGKTGGVPAGKPLVPTAASDGYDADYGNSGGPMKLIIDGVTAADCIENVTSIAVTAAQLTGWTHSTGYYADYKNRELSITGSNISAATTLTVEELENLPNTYKVFDQYKVGNDLYFEGIDLLKLLRDYIGFSGGLSSSNITVTAKDNYSISFTATDLENGVNGKPIIIAYGQGISSTNGLPLVDGNDTTDVRNGFDANIGNAFGPLRLIVHDNTGWCNKWVTSIVVGAGGSTPTTYDFTVTSGSQVTGYDIPGIKSITEGAGGMATASYQYTSGGSLKTDYVKGIYLTDLLKAAGISGGTIKVTINTTDGFETKQESYRDIPLADLTSKKYFLAYDAGESADSLAAIADKDKNDAEASVRIYRKYDDGSTWLNRLTSIKGITISGNYTFVTYPGTGNPGELPLASVRDIVIDAGGGMWVGTNGGGAWYKPVNSDSFTINTLNTQGYVLSSDLVYAIAIDGSGGIWFTQSKTYNPAQGHLNKGVAYVKDGNIAYYNKDVPNTIPDNYVQEVRIDNSGSIWFGSFGGLTRYNPTAGTWTSWDQNYKDSDGDSFPAVSVDNLICDNQGGVWLGFYPSGAGTEADPFVGGFAHMDKDGNITPYRFTADYDSNLGSSLLAQVWVRDIAIDKNGGAWVVASGSYTDLANVGGTVWYVNPQGVATKCTGDQLLPGKLTGNSELRMVTVDSDGGLWLGSSGDGLFYIANPGTTAPLTVTAQFNGANNAWPNTTQFNNIYALEIIGDTIYLGSDGGVMTALVKDLVSSSPGNGEPGIPTEYDLTIDGPGVSTTRYYTIKQLKNAPGLVKTTASYNWLNSYGTTGTDSFEGVYLANLLQDVVGLTSGAKSITVTASDGYFRSFNLDSEPLGVYWTDMQGNKLMLAWKQNGSNCNLQLVVGQTDTNHVNKPMWVSNVVRITVNASSTTPGSGTPGKYEGQKPDEQQSPSTGQVVVSPQVTGNTATSNVTADHITQALEQIQNTGSNEGTPPVVEINATSNAAAGQVQNTTVNLSPEAVRSLAAAGNVSVCIKTDLGQIILPPAVVQLLAAGNNEGFSINLSQSTVDNLNSETQESVGSRPVVNITINRGGQEVSGFNGSQVQVAIPYQAQETENPNNLLIYYIGEDGNSKPVKISHFDEASGQMVFNTVHLSLYAVGYKAVTFADIRNHWAKDSIEYLAAREVIKGKSPDRFDPEGKVTRAEFVTMLANSVDGIDVTGAARANFADVAPGVWYANYVNWAVAKGIVSGYNGSRFGPNDPITREQMAVIMDNFIKANNTDLKLVNEKKTFTDQDKISIWATAPVAKMQQYGIIGGRPDGSFAPKGTTTRAEAAAVIKGYMYLQ